ncbi:peptidylprolyl isomerase [Thioalkalivibrio sp. ALM2T]|uniref:FKBP-type peptidyl-prolyl cis-trans isomerase n=1 Tax=Thioalkalivibrio sp. ALM2T TaxID=1158184 RepID=UPI0003780DC4|nr:FKBP-type peptidyl-prolyl cis-trans isomerase [Thioalkalivibrio sp. ALM2T]
MNVTIIRGATVTLQYQVSDDEDGSPLDESLRHDPETSIRYIHGQEEPGLPGLAPALQGMQAGSHGEIVIPPVLAFGEHRPELVFEAVRENLPADAALEPGKPLYSRSERGVFQLRVLHLTQKGAMLDGNHPMAGRVLRVHYRILQVEDAEDSPHPRTATGG